MPGDPNHFDVIIVGGGPAGCTAGIHLAGTGLRIALLDKAILPNEKICGDALSGTVMNVLRKFPDQVYTDFLEIPGLLPSWGIRFVAPSQEILDVPFVQERTNETPVPGFTCRRADFDGFLIRQLEKYHNISLFPGTQINDVRVSSGNQVIVSGKQFRFTSSVVVGADGVNSLTGKMLAGNKPDHKRLCLGVRGYYEGVTDLHPENFIELHFIRDLLPNYLWIFPMQGGMANVGLGMMPGQVMKSHISPARKLEELILCYPNLLARFSKARLIGKLETHTLPMGHDNNRISGTRFLLAGDAASLVDPFTGEGIGNAMISGEIAATFIRKAFSQNDFSEDFFRGYEEAIRNKIGKEF